MKSINQIYLVILMLLIYSSCGEENNVEPVPSDNIEDCEIEEFYARMLINGECWSSGFEYFMIETSVIDLRIRKEDKFEEELNFRIPLSEIQLNDSTMFKGTNESSCNLFVTEGKDALVARFEPKYNLEKEGNWIMVENINADSTIISGKFEAILYSDSPQGSQSIYDRPDKLVITDGQFRIKRIE